MEWREIRRSNEIAGYIEEIWKREQAMPRFFRDASKIWGSEIVNLAAFITDCQEIHGLFDGERLIVCVYVEKQTSPHEITIHLSLLRKLPTWAFIEQAGNLRNSFFHRGITRIRGWVLKRNFALCSRLESIGFLDTELSIDKGVSHGRTLRWGLMEVRA